MALLHRHVQGRLAQRLSRIDKCMVRNQHLSDPR